MIIDASLIGKEVETLHHRLLHLNAYKGIIHSLAGPRSSYDFSVLWTDKNGGYVNSLWMTIEGSEKFQKQNPNNVYKCKLKNNKPLEWE